MLGLKKKYRYFTIPYISFLLTGFFEDSEKYTYDLQDAIKNLFRVR